MGKFFRQRTESNPDLYCKSGLSHCLPSFDADELCAEDTEGVSMTVEDIGTSEITILIANNSGEEFTYGEYFSLQKQIDGQWYTMPVRADNVGFQDIAHILPDGESVSETYNLDIYGTLEPGMYRLVVETLSIEFLVGHGRMAGTEGEENAP